MNEYLFFIGDYLKGKPVYPVLRRTLNILFSVSLTSFLFEKFYFKYSLIDITDYKAIFTFLIKGNFFVPFSIFVIIHYFLSTLSDGFFSFMIQKKSGKILKQLREEEFSKPEYKKFLKEINENRIVEMPVQLNESTFIEIYNHLQTAIPPEKWNAAKLALEKQKENTQESFKLAFKALITITIYFFIVPHFGLTLYLLTLIVLLVILFGLFYGYLLMDILPSFIKYFHYEVVKYLKSKSVV